MRCASAKPSLATFIVAEADGFASGRYAQHTNYLRRGAQEFGSAESRTFLSMITETKPVHVADVAAGQSLH